MNAEQVDDHVQSVHTSIRSLLERYRRRPGNLRRILKLLKFVYSHEAMEFADIRTVVNYPNIKNLLSDEEAPTICDKQVVPNSTYFCNFSKILKEIPDIHANFPPSDQCSCRTLVHNYADLQDGHVMTTNHNCIKIEYFAKNFTKEWSTSTTWVQAVYLNRLNWVQAVTDYSRKLHESITLTDEEERNIVSCPRINLFNYVVRI